MAKKIVRKKVSTYDKEFRKHFVTGVTAAGAFLIALTWREPISKHINIFIDRLGLSNGILAFEYVSAIIVTMIVVLIIMFASKIGK